MSEEKTVQEKAQEHALARSGNSKKATLADKLERASSAIRSRLPRHLSPERMIKIAHSAATGNKYLMECTPTSIISATIKAAELGLEPSDILGQAFLVPYKNKHSGHWEAQLQIGYRGFIELAHRSDRVADISAEVVYESDEFEYQLGTERFIKHRPNLKRRKDEAILCAYATVEYKNGARSFVLLPMAELMEAKSHSQRKTKGPWDTHFPEMAKKTAVRRLAKQLPLSPELQGAAAQDENRDFGVIDTEFEVVPDEETEE